jgi:hypothetical protein
MPDYTNQDISEEHDKHERFELRGRTRRIAECFTPRLRYSGSSIGYQLSSVISGGPAPLIATALLAATGSGYVIAIWINTASGRVSSESCRRALQRNNGRTAADA